MIDYPFLSRELCTRLNIGASCLDPECAACVKERAVVLDALRSLADQVRSDQREQWPHSAEELETLAFRLEQPHSEFVAKGAAAALRRLAAALRQAGSP